MATLSSGNNRTGSQMKEEKKDDSEKENIWWVLLLTIILWRLVNCWNPTPLPPAITTQFEGYQFSSKKKNVRVWLWLSYECVGFFSCIHSSFLKLVYLKLKFMFMCWCLVSGSNLFCSRLRASVLGEVQLKGAHKLSANQQILVIGRVIQYNCRRDLQSNTFNMCMSLGDRESGKTTLVAKLQGNVDPKKGSGLEYAYIDVRDEYRDGTYFLFHILNFNNNCLL